MMTLRIPLREPDGSWDTHDAYNAMRQEAETARKERRETDWKGLAAWGKTWGEHSEKGRDRKAALLAYFLEGDDLNDEVEVRANVDCVRALLAAGWDAQAFLIPRRGEEKGQNMCECLLSSGNPSMRELVQLLGQYNGGFGASDLHNVITNATTSGVHWARDKSNKKLQKAFEGLMGCCADIVKHLQEDALEEAWEDSSLLTMACLCPRPEPLNHLIGSGPPESRAEAFGVSEHGIGCANFWRLLLGSAVQNPIDSENTETVRWILAQYPFQPQGLTMALKLARTQSVAQLLLNAGAQPLSLVEAVDASVALPVDPDNPLPDSPAWEDRVEDQRFGEYTMDPSTHAHWKIGVKYVLDFARHPLPTATQKGLDEMAAMQFVRAMATAQLEKEQLSAALRGTAGLEESEEFRNTGLLQESNHPIVPQKNSNSKGIKNRRV